MKKKKVVVCYIDDLLTFTHDHEEINTVKEHLPDKLLLSDLGFQKRFLEIELIWISNETVGLLESSLIEKLLSFHRIEKASPTTSPMIPSDFIAEETPLFSEEQTTHYRSIVGR